MNHQFSMEILCKYGVRYLSRDEEAQCLIIASQRYNRTSAIVAVDVKVTDKQTIDFLQAARRMINWWLAQSVVCFPPSHICSALILAIDKTQRIPQHPATQQPQGPQGLVSSPP